MQLKAFLTCNISCNVCLWVSSTLFLEWHQIGEMSALLPGSQALAEEVVGELQAWFRLISTIQHKSVLSVRLPLI